MSLHLNRVLTVGNHLLPVFLTLGVIVALLMVYKGFPYLHYIFLVANAKDQDGINDLAKYLAKNTGGKRINVDRAWESYIPAATELHDLYLRKALKIHFRNNDSKKS